MMMITQDLTLALIEYLAAICGEGNQQARDSVWATIEMWAKVIYIVGELMRWDGHCIKYVLMLINIPGI